MLVELVVRDLGVIAQARIPFDSGMTALTGETGAGKTLLVEALRLLCGEKADPSRVRAGADEAVVEALFQVPDAIVLEGAAVGAELVLRRVVPAGGRSRCYLNGDLVPAARLTEIAAELVEIHGQHGHQALLDPRHQRAALDRFGGIDRSRLEVARRELAELERHLAALGGDDGTRSRQVGLLEHQIAEIEAVAPRIGEQEELSAQEDLLAGAVAYRTAAEQATSMLNAESAAADHVARARALLGEAPPFAEVATRLAALEAELADCVAELRVLAEAIEPDEERLAAVQDRQASLVQLRRKYGDTLGEVLDFAARARAELAELSGLDARRGELAERIEAARIELAVAAAEVGASRRSAAPKLAAAVAKVLGDLALGGAAVEVAVEDTDDLPGAGQAVEILIGTNAGQRVGPLRSVASGGELSRVMLALRLVLSGGPPTMVFDEVDAGVGGAAAAAVGSALASLGRDCQVLVVTHLAQVASCAGAQVVVDKRTDGHSTATDVRSVGGEDRVVEISRMLSGSPDSEAAREHAQELLSATGDVGT